MQMRGGVWCVLRRRCDDLRMRQPIRVVEVKYATCGASSIWMYISGVWRLNVCGLAIYVYRLFG